MCHQLNRRSFIVATGLTALASTRVLGANDTVRVGVIGAGGRMSSLLNAADHVSQYQIVAVSDVYGPRRDAIKLRSNGIATTNVYYREVLQQQIESGLSRHRSDSLATEKPGLSGVLEHEAPGRRFDR